MASDQKWVAKARPVVAATADGAPVRRPERCEQGVAPQRCHLDAEQWPQHHDEADDREAGRHEAAHAGAPEVAEADARVAVVLGEEAPGDQPARDDEEGVDAEVAAVEVAEVECHDQAHRHRTQAVEPRPVAR
jgi:hypothetical protein